MRKYGPWTIHSTKTVYSDPWLSVSRDEVTRPDGDPGSYATVQIKSGVCVLALDDRGTLHLTKEFHYAVGKVTIEGVSGGIEEGESPELAAERELAEELGLRAAKWMHLGTVDPFTAAVFSRVDLFLAQELTTCEKNPEGTELIEAMELELDKALAMVRNSEITHCPTCAGILHLALMRCEGTLAR